MIMFYNLTPKKKNPSICHNYKKTKNEFNKIYRELI